MIQLPVFLDCVLREIKSHHLSISHSLFDLAAQNSWTASDVQHAATIGNQCDDRVVYRPIITVIVLGQDLTLLPFVGIDLVPVICGIDVRHGVTHRIVHNCKPVLYAARLISSTRPPSTLSESKYCSAIARAARECFS